MLNSETSLTKHADSAANHYFLPVWQINVFIIDKRLIALCMTEGAGYVKGFCSLSSRVEGRCGCKRSCQQLSWQILSKMFCLVSICGHSTTQYTVLHPHTSIHSRYCSTSIFQDSPGLAVVHWSLTVTKKTFGHCWCSSFLQAGCSFLTPNQQCQSTEGNTIYHHNLSLTAYHLSVSVSEPAVQHGAGRQHVCPRRPSTAVVATGPRHGCRSARCSVSVGPPWSGDLLHLRDMFAASAAPWLTSTLAITI